MKMTVIAGPHKRIYEVNGWQLASLEETLERCKEVVGANHFQVVIEDGNISHVLNWKFKRG
jgi:hypothetical protein